MIKDIDKVAKLAKQRSGKTDFQIAVELTGFMSMAKWRKIIDQAQQIKNPDREGAFRFWLKKYLKDSEIK